MTIKGEIPSFQFFTVFIDAGTTLDASSRSFLDWFKEKRARGSCQKVTTTFYSLKMQRLKRIRNKNHWSIIGIQKILTTWVYQKYSYTTFKLCFASWKAYFTDMSFFLLKNHFYLPYTFDNWIPLKLWLREGSGPESSLHVETKSSSSTSSSARILHGRHRIPSTCSKISDASASLK